MILSHAVGFNISLTWSIASCAPSKSPESIATLVAKDSVCNASSLMNPAKGYEPMIPTANPAIASVNPVFANIDFVNPGRMKDAFKRSFSAFSKGKIVKKLLTYI